MSLCSLSAIFSDDCVTEEYCRHGNCWQDLKGNCLCNGYKCTGNVVFVYKINVYIMNKKSKVEICQPKLHGYFFNLKLFSSS